MAPRMQIKSRRGSRQGREDEGTRKLREEVESSKPREGEWGSLEYGCIIEEEKPEELPQFD